MRKKVYLEKLSIWNCSIIVHVIDTKSKSELGFLVSFNTELGDSLYEFCGVEMLKSIVRVNMNVGGTFKVHFAIPILVKYVNHPLD